MTFLKVFLKITCMRFTGYLPKCIFLAMALVPLTQNFYGNLLIYRIIRGMESKFFPEDIGRVPSAS